MWLVYFCLIKAALLKKGSRVLDFGCGIGNLVWALRKFRIDACGIDSAVSALKYSREPKYCLYQNTAKLPYPDNHFDLVYSNEVLEHIPKDHLEMVMKELDRVSKGVMIHMVGVSDRGRMVTEEPTHEIIEPETWWKKYFVKMGFATEVGNLFYFFPHIHLILTGMVNLSGIKKGYFLLKKRSQDR